MTRPNRLAVAAGVFVSAVLPLLATPFLTVQIYHQALFLATAALSLTFLAHYSGMLSLAQLALCGLGGYTLPRFVTVTYGLPRCAGA
jgi:ABC-type branched-subunit amino acid transport system permease subunit